MPFADRSCTMKSIVLHHLYMKTGSGYDRTFPDAMMTFEFGWGKADIQQQFRKSEIEYLTESQLTSMQGAFEKVIADYQVSSNERIKRITYEMLMLGHSDSDSHRLLSLHPKPCSKPGEKLFSDQGVTQGQETGDSMEAMEPVLVRQSRMEALQRFDLERLRLRQSV